MEPYLPWWAAATLLALITLVFYLFLKRPLGVSGSWTRVIQWKDDAVLSEAEQTFSLQPKIFEDALMAATIQEFGEHEVKLYIESRHKHKPTVQEAPKEVLARTPWTAHLVFLLMLAVGGYIGAMLKGQTGVQFNLGELHTSLFGSGISRIMTLLVGGLLVGFGTQLGGGCTSGHGLSGVSRLVPASLIATGAFFGTAIVISLAIHYFG